MSDSFTFDDIKYEVGATQILLGVSGSFPKGRISAVFGPTGAGKSSFLDILASRKDASSGRIHLNGRTGYVVQDDILQTSLTCRENISFSAMLRLDRNKFSSQDREKLIDKTIEDLGLLKVQHALVGDGLCRGLSGGERKRVNIGTELVIQPDILFLDEPTSGLDSAMAVSVCDALHELAERGCTICMSLHQPRYSIFRRMDHILLLSQGKLVFQGPPDHVVVYFESVGYTCDKFDNPADFMLDTLSGVVPENTASSGFSSAHEKLVDSWIRTAKPQILAESGMVQVFQRPGFYSQFQIISRRNITILSRLPQVVLMQFGVMIFFGVITGIIYWKLDLTQNGLQNRLGVFFFLIMSMVFGNLSAIEIFLKERVLFVHQKSNKYYDTGPYFLSMLLCDLIPMRVFPMIIYSTICYTLMGLQPQWSNFGWFLATLIIEAVCAGTLCYMMSAWIGVFTIANLAVSVAFVVSMIFGGLLVNLDTLPVFMQWIKYLSFFKYGYESLAVTELHGLTFEGISGDDILKIRGFSLDARPTDLMALALLSVVFSVLAYVALDRLKVH